MKNERILKVLLMIFVAINVIIGILVFTQGKLANLFVALFYGAEVQFTPQLVHVMRMFGAMSLAMAYLGWKAFQDPIKNREIINGAIILLSLRGLEMIVFSKEIVTYFNITPARNIANMCSYFAMATLLYIFRPKAQ